MKSKTFKITISGQVQGVGFRPFVYSLAQKHQFKGQVFNNEQGVVIQINTSKKEAEQFLAELLHQKPAISTIISSELTSIEFEEFSDFNIIKSQKSNTINVPLTTDFAVCENCKTEVQDPKNRRFGYAFTTCVNCGPRFSITTKFPFEREHTALKEFEMCETCQTEYENPNDKRFHSQTNSCKTCGIQLKLVDNQAKLIEDQQGKILKKTAQLITKGKIIAIKNTNGYLLCCDASNPEAIKKLRQKKNRQKKPFALLYPHLEAVEKDYQLSEAEREMLTSPIAPIVILKAKKILKSIERERIAPNLNQFGVMLPSSTLLYLLMAELDKPIIATSGNLHGSPIISSEENAQEELGKLADYLVHHNLDVQFPQDDSVMKFSNDGQVILRRSRGLAPNYLEKVSTFKKPVLAMGAHLKSTFSFVPNAHTYISPYFGNLDNYAVLKRFQNTIKQFTEVFETQPQTILVDAHPQYQSTILGHQLAEDWTADIIKIQHHKAHFASVLGENELFDSEEEILGVVWDGTGYGDDQQIWGGEFLTYKNQEMQRLTHFDYVDWIAGDQFSKEPRLCLLSLLPEDERKTIQHKFSETEWNIYLKLFQNNALKTSSVGRLFDAVASALVISAENSFEGESAMLLETIASTYEKNDLINFSVFTKDFKIDSKAIVSEISKQYSKGISKEKLARSFIFSLAKICIEIALKKSIKIIAVSGGVFQNVLLLNHLLDLCNAQSIMLKKNRKLSCNDENISFGQLMFHQNIK